MPLHLASVCVWTSPPSVVWLRDCDQEPCVVGLGLFGHWHSWSCVLIDFIECRSTCHCEHSVKAHIRLCTAAKASHGHILQTTLCHTSQNSGCIHLLQFPSSPLPPRCSCAETASSSSGKHGGAQEAGAAVQGQDHCCGAACTRAGRERTRVQAHCQALCKFV